MMKKTLIIVSLLVITICSLVSCSANRRGDLQSPSTTLTAEHTAMFTAREENIMPSAQIGDDSTTQGSTTKPDKSDIADNIVEFETTVAKQNQTTATTKSTSTTHSTTTTVSTETTKPTEKETTSATKTTTKLVTDKDGWINKWY